MFTNKHCWMKKNLHIKRRKPRLELKETPPINSISDLIEIGRSIMYYKNINTIMLWRITPYLEELDNLIKLHISSKADYSRSFSELPKGLGSEIFTFNALEESFLYGLAENHKEHVNEYIEENENNYRISELKVSKEKNRPEISLTVDNMDDYKKACFIIEHSKNEYTTTQEAIKLCLQFV